MEVGCPGSTDMLDLVCLSYLKKLSLSILTQLSMSNNRPEVLKSACTIGQKCDIIGDNEPQIVIQLSLKDFSNRLAYLKTCSLCKFRLICMRAVRPWRRSTNVLCMVGR